MGAAILALHDALEAFTQIAPRQSRVVELRYFGGLSVEETAEVMKISQRTVMRDWDFAKAWLARACSTGRITRIPPFGKNASRGLGTRKRSRQTNQVAAVSGVSQG